MCREKHVSAESFMVYSVVFEGVVECSNTMEDEEDTELLPQALIYKTCRQRMYGVLLPCDKGTCSLLIIIINQSCIAHF